LLLWSACNCPSEESVQAIESEQASYCNELNGILRAAYPDLILDHLERFEVDSPHGDVTFSRVAFINPEDAVPGKRSYLIGGAYIFGFLDYRIEGKRISELTFEAGAPHMPLSITCNLVSLSD